MLADRLVHDRLRRGRLVRLVVAVAAVADEVDDDVLAELHPVVEREARDEDDGLGIVGIHVEDRRLDHLRNVAAIERRSRVRGFAGREPDLVVDDDVQRPACREAPRLRELQRLHDDALPRKCRVAVDEKRENRAARRVAALLLARAHRTLDHGIHDLEVRRVEREHGMDIAARRAQVRREALVILDVAGAFRGVVLELAFELGEKHRGRLAEHIDQHVEPAAMRHADDDFLDARGPASLHDVVEQRDQCVAALEREPLLADILCVQIALESLCSRELPQEVQALVIREAVMKPSVLEAVLKPQALFARRNVRELRADAPGIDVPQLLQELRQLHLLVDAARAAAGVEVEIHVGFGEADVGRIEHARHWPLHEAERVDVRDQVAAVRVELDEARDGGLLLADRGGRGRSCCRCYLAAEIQATGLAGDGSRLQRARRRRTGRRNHAIPG